MVFDRPFCYTSTMVNSHKHIHVSCAIIERDGLVLTAQRSSAMTLPLKWEFPGGKIDPGESPEECLSREVMEEMGVRVHVGRTLPPHTHCYSTFTVTLYPFVCSMESGEIVLHEHADMLWLAPERLRELDWAEADYPVIDSYLGSLNRESISGGYDAINIGVSSFPA
jgi:8-oxo-dGTP diphosphatase